MYIELVILVLDLRLEGEALAKQNGKQAEIIRKLRAKEKTAEAEAKKLRADTERLTGQSGVSISIQPFVAGPVFYKKSGSEAQKAAFFRTR